MTTDIAVELGQSALIQVLTLCAPPLIVAAAIVLLLPLERVGDEVVRPDGARMIIRSRAALDVAQLTCAFLGDHP